MNIKLVTLFDEKLSAIGSVSSRIMAEYCHKRGYQFVCYNHLPDKSRGAQWNKTRIVQQELSDCDWLVWMDADSIPVNHSFSIEIMIQQMPGKDLIISGDDAGLCFGVFAVRNCAWSVQFFQTLWFCGQMEREKALKYHVAPQFDQPTVIALTENFPAIASRVAVIGQDWVAHPRSEFSRESFAVHYWASDNGHDSIARRMSYFLENGWQPAAHRDIGIVRFARTSPSGIIEALKACGQIIACLNPNVIPIRRFDEVNTQDYDVGVTMRRKEERGATSRPMLNGFLDDAVLFFNYTPAAFNFLEAWQKECVITSDHQEALNALVLQATDLTEYDKVFYWKGIRIKVFRCETYNYSRWPQEPAESVKIVNCNRPESLEDWGSRGWSHPDFHKI